MFSPALVALCLHFSLSVQACVNSKDQLGRQAIHLASLAGCNTSLDYLIKNVDADVNVRTEGSKMTPLHLAAKVSSVISTTALS